MRIAFYISTLQGGGAGRVISILASELSRRGYDCALLSTHYIDRGVQYSLDEGVRQIPLHEDVGGNKLGNNLRRMATLRKVLKSEQPDILITFLPEPIIRALLCTIGLPIKNVVSIRADPANVWRSWPIRLLSRALLKRADLIVSQTHESADYYGALLAKKTRVIYNPIDEKFYSTTVANREKTILTLGRLDKNKNHAMLIEAFSLFWKNHPDWQMKIFGEGPEKEALKTLSTQLGVEGVVELCGITRNPVQELLKSSIFALPSNSEGLPNALMEAMASGTPCISTDCPCGGPKELLARSNCGLLVPVNDAKAMAKALETLANDSHLRFVLSERGRKRAEDYKTEVIVTEWENALLAIE